MNTFFDLQINGYAGVDFNQNGLDLESLHNACKKLKETGVEGILATIITANFKDMKLRLRRIADLREVDKLIKDMVKGIHIEGPFLNSKVGFRGAHPENMICKADLEKMKELLDAADGLTRIVTLAPEADNEFKVTEMLSKNNIVVSAGHCNSSLDELNGAIDAGLSMFTHLGNGCPKELNRHDNIIQRVLSLKDKLWICLIADGIHIPFFALKNYLKLIGFEKSIIVTDAMAGAGMPSGQYTLSHITLEVGEDRIVREPGKTNFAGSAISMKESKDNLIKILGINEDNVMRLLNINPMRAIGMI